MKTMDGKILGQTTLTMGPTKEPGLQNVSFVPFSLFFGIYFDHNGQNVGPGLLLLAKILNNFATLLGKASVMLHGYTYTYMHRKPRKGQKGPCCRPTKQKCRRDNNLRNVCKTKSGRTKCGEGCTRLIEALEGLQRKEQMKKKKKEEKLKKAKLMQNLGQKPGRQTEDSESFEEYSSESEEYSDEYQDTAKKEIPPKSAPYAKKRGDPNVFRRSETKQEGGSNMGLRVKKGQKLSQKQLNMLESASQVRKTSTNPLCKEKPNLFRSHFDIQK